MSRPRCLTGPNEAVVITCSSRSSPSTIGGPETVSVSHGQAALRTGGEMRYNDDGLSRSDGRSQDEASLPLVIATILRGDGITGVDTHIRQLRRYLEESGTSSTLVTPFSWGRALTVPCFRLPSARTGSMLQTCKRRLVSALARGVPPQRPASAPRRSRRLRRLRPGSLGRAGGLACAARAAPTRGLGSSFPDLHGRRVGRQEADQTRRVVFRAIRQVEREVIPQVDRLVYVSRWARDALLNWLPEAAAVPSAVIGNFVAPLHSNTAPGAARGPGHHR